MLTKTRRVRPLQTGALQLNTKWVIQNGLRARLWGKLGKATLRPQMIYTGGRVP